MSDNVVDLNKYKIDKLEKNIKKQGEDITKTVKSLDEYEFIKFAAYAYSELKDKVDERHAMLFLSQLFNIRLLHIEDQIFDLIEDDDKR